VRLAFAVAGVVVPSAHDPAVYLHPLAAPQSTSLCVEHAAGPAPLLAQVASASVAGATAATTAGTAAFQVQPFATHVVSFCLLQSCTLPVVAAPPTVVAMHDASVADTAATACEKVQPAGQFASASSAPAEVSKCTRVPSQACVPAHAAADPSSQEHPLRPLHWSPVTSAIELHVAAAASALSVQVAATRPFRMSVHACSANFVQHVVVALSASVYVVAAVFGS